MTKWKLDPKIRRAASGGPRMFALLALPFIERYADEAKEIIYKTMHRAGLKKGKLLAKKAKDPDDLTEFERLVVEDFIDRGANTPGYDDPARRWIVRSKNRCSYDQSLSGGCEYNIPQVWKDMGLDAKTIRMLGDLYCVPGDLGVREGFNKNLKFKFTKLAPRGDPYCEWFEEIED